MGQHIGKLDSLEAEADRKDSHMSSDDIYSEKYTQKTNQEVAWREGINIEDYPDVIPYDADVHPRDTKEYPYGRIKCRGTMLLKLMWVHGTDRYGFTNAQRVKKTENIEIICPSHGPFYQRISNFLKGGWCKECFKERRLKSNDKFLEEAKEAHKNSPHLDFSKTKYDGARNNVTVTCEIHGDFSISPTWLVRGSGCQSCARESVGKKRRIPYDEFLRRAKQVHGDEFTYDEGSYTLTNEKMRITCSAGHEFWMKPNDHVGSKQQGCGRCLGMHKEIGQFILESREVHGDKFDYSESIYEGSRVPLKIKCTNGHEFWMNPNAHVSSKQGCPQCRPNLTYGSGGHWVTRAKEKHGNLYDYSKVPDIVKAADKVPVICAEHGVFYTNASAHINAGYGCGKCSGTIKLTTDEFIKKAKEKHGDRYDYSEVEYITTSVHVKIGCPEHGTFHQTPNNHLRGSGCPECARRKLTRWNLGNFSDEELEEPCLLYLVKITNKETGDHFMKIGITVRSVRERFALLDKDVFEMETLLEEESNRMISMDVEERVLSELEKRNERYRVHDLRGLDVGGWTECFRGEEDDVMKLINEVIGEIEGVC